MPKVSVIIPTYNRANYISEAIDSVLDQTFQDFEIIIIDDGSTDNTKTVLAKYGSKIKYFYKNNGGEGSARNLGIKKARGQYIAFLDSDDLWLPSKIEKQLSFLERNPKFDLVYTTMSIIDEFGNLKEEVRPTRPARNLSQLLDGYRIPMTVLVKKLKLLEAGYFDETMKVAEDTDMWIRFARLGVIDFLNEPLALYRKHSNNISNDVKDAYLGHIKIFKKIINDNGFKLPKRIKKMKLAREYYLLAKEQYRTGIYNEAFIFALHSISTFFLVGLNFVDRNDTFLTKLSKIIKPYLALGVYLFKFSLTDWGREKFNILYYEASSGFGGSANSLANLITHLDKERFRAVVIIRNFGPQIEKIKHVKIIKINNYEEKNQLHFIQYIAFLIRYVLPESIFIYFIIKRYKISLVHINTNIIDGIAPIVAAKIAGIPCVSHVRRTGNLLKREIFFSRWVNKFIVLNSTSFKIYEEFVDRDKIELIPDGIDFQNFRINTSHSLRNEFNLDSSFLIGLVGRIVEGKGHKEFILAAKKTICSHKNVKFLIVGGSVGGDDKYFNEIKKFVTDNALEENVILTGWRNDVKNILSDLDVLVQSSTLPEGFGLTCIEAMALGKSVLATNIPGPSEIVVDEKTGFLVPPGDVNAMAEKMIYLLENQEVANKMGKEGRDRVEKFFNIKNTVKKIEDLYIKTMLGKN